MQTWQPGRRFCTFGCAQLTELARNFAPNCSGRTNRSGSGSSHWRRTAHQPSQQAQTSCVPPRGSVLQQSGTKLAAMTVRTEKTPPAGRYPLRDWLTPRQSLPQPPKRWMLGIRCTNGAPSTGSIGWSCKKGSMMFSAPSTSGGTLGDRRAQLSLSDSDVETVEGPLSQQRSGHVHPEQELWGKKLCEGAGRGCLG